jgi:hypothetical protein
LAADAAKYGPEVGGISNTDTDEAVNAWLSVKLLPSLIEGAGSINATAIMNYLNRQSAFSTGGATPPINFVSTAVSETPRLKDLCAFKGSIENGQVMQTVSTAYCFKG